MKKVKCVYNNSKDYHLTSGALYTVFKEDDNEYTIINDKGLSDWYPKFFFKEVNMQNQHNELSEGTDGDPIDVELDRQNILYSQILSNQLLANRATELDNNQELYDRVAIATLQALISNSTIDLSSSHQSFSKMAFQLADAFMAERENRLKDNYK